MFRKKIRITLILELHIRAITDLNQKDDVLSEYCRLKL